MYTGAVNFPVLTQEHRARPGEVHRHQGVKQSGREPSLNDQLAELCPGDELAIEVEWIVVARQLGERFHVLGRERETAGGPLADRGLHGRVERRDERPDVLLPYRRRGVRAMARVRSLVGIRMYRARFISRDQRSMSPSSGGLMKSSAELIASTGTVTRSSAALGS